ncbi:MAG: hypothetical protein HRT35_29735, partial [Algicola sp.]|nr:hypothetical protein [Algicola sp.]
MINTTIPSKSCHFTLYKTVLAAAIMLFSLGSSLASVLTNPGPVVTHIQQIDGHSTNNISRMLQDSNGFIWFARFDGLLRFDGYKIKKYQHQQNNPNSLANNFISAMQEDEQGYIWLATDDGLSRFNPANEQFDNFGHIKDDTTTLDSNQLFSLSLAEDHKLWIGSDHGINLFDRKSLTNQRLNSSLKPSDSTTFEDIQHILQDSQQRLWFSVEKKGLYLHDLSSNTTTRFEQQQNSGLYSSVISRIVQTPDSTIWIGTHNGLNQYHENLQRFVRIEATNHNNPAANIRIQSITRDNLGRIWAGALHYGASHLQAGDGSAMVLSHENIPQALRQSDVSDILQDSSGSIWLTTSRKGLFKIAPMALLFEQYRLTDKVNGTIESMYLDGQNVLWLGTGEHLYRFDTHSRQLDIAVENVGVITAIGKNDDNHLVFKVLGEGLFYYNPSTTNHERMIASGINKTPLPANISDTINVQQQLDNYSITSILRLKDEILAATALNGLRWLDIKTKQWSKVTDETHDIRRIWQLLQDNKQRVWIATDAAGLAQLDVTNHTLKFTTVEDGLPTNSIRSLVADKQGNLWLGTAKGLVRFNPQTGQITSFDQDDGMRVGSFEQGKSVITTNGQVIMASNNTLLLFKPSQVDRVTAQSNQKLPLLLSDFRLFNQPVELRAQDPNSPLINTLNASQTLALRYDQDWFSLAFASSNFNVLDKIRYSYQMQGVSEQWIEADQGNRKATFTSLAYKDYVLKIRASEADGSWSDQYRTIKITVSPPFWLTWQAYLLYVSAIIGSIYVIYRYRTRALIKRAETLAQIVEDRTAKLNRLMDHKEQMFANISHEFKTPLTLITTPLSTLLASVESVLPPDMVQEVGRKKTMILRNGQRLLRMIDQLLALLALDAEKTQTLSNYSLTKMLNTLLVSFQPMLDSKNLKLDHPAFDDVTLTTQ